MTRDEKERIALLYEKLERQSTDPHWRPGQATASHKLEAIKDVLDILGYEIVQHPLFNGTSVSVRKIKPAKDNIRER